MKLLPRSAWTSTSPGGSPLPGPVADLFAVMDPISLFAFARRFWTKVDRSGGPEACWVWRAGTWRRRGGYGKFQLGTSRAENQAGYSHRIAWELVNGPIPEGQHVLHRCDNPPCVNPAHLFLGDQAANNRDAAAKGRADFWGWRKRNGRRAW